MRTSNAADVFEEAKALGEWLADGGLVPYIDFEVLTVTLEDQAVEVDPLGDPRRLLPLLHSFSKAHAFEVLPFDEELGTFTIARDPLLN